MYFTDSLNRFINKYTIIHPSRATTADELTQASTYSSPTTEIGVKMTVQTLQPNCTANLPLRSDVEFTEVLWFLVLK